MQPAGQTDMRVRHVNIRMNGCTVDYTEGKFVLQGKFVIIRHVFSKDLLTPILGENN